MNFRKHLEKAWYLLVNNLLILIFMTLAMLVVSALTLGILAPVVAAGYLDSMIRLARDGREPSLQDIFSQMSLFLPLLAFGFGSLIICLIGYAIFFPFGVLLACGITFGFIYVIPLMCDKRLSLAEAARQSWSMATSGQVIDHLVLVVLFLGISVIGSSIFIGTFVTTPFAAILLASVYIEKTGGRFSTADESRQG